MSVAGTTAAAATGCPDPELRPEQPNTDLHALRAADPDLDRLSAAVQRGAAACAAARLRQHDGAHAAALAGKRVLVTGSAGYLGAALHAALRDRGAEVVGFDLVEGPTVDVVASVADAVAVHTAAAGCHAVMHTAARHAPHAAHLPEAEFISTNVTGTQNVLDAASAAGACCVVHTSTTSLTITPRVKSLEASGAVVWLDESAQSPAPAGAASSDPLDAPRNKYGRTKLEGERRCVAAAKAGLPVVVVRISRCFPEAELPGSVNDATLGLSTANIKANELLGRRVALVDAVDGHLRALARCREPAVFGAVIMLSAPWPWSRDKTPTVAADMPRFVEMERPQLPSLYAELGWSLPPTGRVYDSSHAMKVLGWRPTVTFDTMLAALARGDTAGGEASDPDFDASAVRAGRY